MARKQIESIRTGLQNLTKRQLLSLITNLCEHDEEIVNLCQSRLGQTDWAWYKRRIQRGVRPNPMELEDPDFERPTRLFRSYRKITGDWAGTIDLMLYAVEQGNKFTLDYGDIYAEFYDQLEKIFEDGLNALRRHPECLTDEIRDRIMNIRDETEGLGYGYHDTLAHMVAEFFDDDREEAEEKPEQEQKEDVPMDQRSKEQTIAELEEEIRKLKEIT